MSVEGGPGARLRRRLVLASGGLSLVVAILLVVVVQAVLEWTSGDNVDRLLEDRADAVVGSIEVVGGAPRVPDTSLVPGVAVYDDRGILVAGSVPPSQQDEFEELSRSGEKTFHQDGELYRLVARPFSAGGSAGPTGVVVVSESLQPYEDQERDALLVCVLAGVLIVALTTALAAWASKRALAPVAQMARTAQEWSARDLDRRFDLGPPTDEIKALGQTLDGLLDRVARTIADEQRLTSELAHELRTPLTAVQSTVDLISLRDDLDDELRADVAELFDHCRAMASTISGLLDLARAQSRTLVPSTPLAEVLTEVLRQVRESDRVSVAGVRGLVLAVPREIAVRALAPVVDNATRHGDHVVVSATATDTYVTIRVRDDGPGIPPASAGSVFEPGVTTTGDGSGLGLALARRVARSVGGEVVLEQPSDGPGVVFSVRLPVSTDPASP